MEIYIKYRSTNIAYYLSLLKFHLSVSVISDIINLEVSVYISPVVSRNDLNLFLA